MALRRAFGLCPQAVFLSGSPERYLELSEQVKAILRERTPQVAPRSIDEFDVDLSGCERLLGDRLERPLLSVMYPQDNEDTQSLLDQSRYAQPAMFALAWALVEMWESFGVTAAVVAGRGVGELAAACAAGIVGFEEGLLLAAERGRLFEECNENGAMAVACASEANVRSLIDKLDDVCIASVNAVDSIVITGTPDAVSRAIRSDLLHRPTSSCSVANSAA